MAAKQDTPVPAVETNDTRPFSADQAPAGDPKPPAPLEGWTGNPDPDENRPHPSEAAAEEASHKHKGMVKVHKDGQDLHVHPDNVESHKAAGWTVA